MAVMPARLLMEWKAAYELDQWGEDLADIRNSLLCALVRNGLRGPKTQAVEADCFRLFKTVSHVRPKTVAEIEDGIRLYLDRYQAVRNRNRGQSST